MSIRIELDWNQALPFDIGNWKVGTHEAWAPSYPDYYGLYNNTITNREDTFFSITAHWEYLEFDYVLDGENSYDYFWVHDDTASSRILKGANSKTPKTFSKTFDGSLRTITFHYSKDGSNDAGYDSCMILRMVVQTANDELAQFRPYFALKDNDTGKLYIVQDSSLAEIDIDLDSADYNAITSTFMQYSEDAAEEVLALNTFENASFISMDMKDYDRLWCDYYTIKHNSIIMDNTARDYTEHEYVEGINTINIQCDLQEGDAIGVAIGIDDDVWVLNNVDSEGNVITYTTEELTPELIIELGFSRDTAVPDGIKSQLLIHRKLKFAYVLDVNSINSTTALNDVRGTFVTPLASSEEQN